MNIKRMSILMATVLVMVGMMMAIMKMMGRQQMPMS